MHLPLQHPFTGIVSGPTGSGKTVFTIKLVQNSQVMVQPPPEDIVWCYGIYQDVFDTMSHVKFVQGLPDVDAFKGDRRTLIVIDDLMHEANDSVSQIFTKGSHHRNLSVLFLTQNLFFNSKHARTMSLNSQYVILFKNPRDVGQISHLGRQMFPNKNGSKFLAEAFGDATSKPYGYLFVDLKADTDERLRIRTNIFPDDVDPHFVYQPK